MTAFSILLILATLLCSLVAGFLFAFAVVVMPGIKTLDDRGFIRAFQAIDGVIQRNQPLFMLVWIGSVVAPIAAVVVGFGQLDVIGRAIIVGATAVYLLGVQLPTMTVNVPLNNALQSVDVDALSPAELQTARESFERRWNRWNVLRTILSMAAVAAWIVLLLRV